MRSPPRIAVVGGGPAGLAAAHRLLRGGALPVVFEAREWVGGRTYTDTVEGYRIDTGTQLFASMYLDLFRLMRELGIRDRLVRSGGRDALWRAGRAHEVVYGSVASMIASGGLPFATKMRLGSTYLPFLKRHAPVLEMHALERAAAAGLDDESIASWGEREMGRDFVDFLVYPQLASFFGGATPDETGAALYHMLAHYGMDVSLFALRGGAGGVCEALAAHVREAGGEVRLSTPIAGVRLVGDGVELSGEGWTESFAGAVVAVPAPDARRILAANPGPLGSWLDEVRYRPTVSLALLLDRPTGVRYFGLSFPRGESRGVVAACVEENKDDSLVPPGRGLLVAFPDPGIAPGLVEAEGRTILDAMLPDLARAFPGLESRVLRARVYRWAPGNPTFYPGYLRHLARFRAGAVEPEAPLALAGDYLSSPCVEGAVTSALRAAERLLKRLGNR